MEKELSCTSHARKAYASTWDLTGFINVSAELTEKLRGREIEESEELFEQVEKRIPCPDCCIKSRTNREL